MGNEAWDLSGSVDWDLTTPEWDLTGDEIHDYKIQKSGGEWCVVSEDGAKKLGCFPTEKQARERLRQIEAAKAAKGNVVVGSGEEESEEITVLVKVPLPKQVLLPEQQAPVVNVSLPEQQAPVVNVSLPEQKAPVVEVKPSVKVLQEAKQLKSRRVERDAKGRIKRIIDEDE